MNRWILDFEYILTATKEKYIFRLCENSSYVVHVDFSPAQKIT